MSSFSKGDITDVNLTCQSILHLYANNQLFPKNMRVNGVSKYQRI